jgi:hypothetical protein
VAIHARRRCRIGRQELREPAGDRSRIRLIAAGWSST